MRAGADRSLLVWLTTAALLAGCGSASPSLVPPSPSAGHGSPSLTPSSASSPSALPTPTTPADPFLGQVAVTVTPDLRVRSQPWVGEGSIRYEPLLPMGTELKVLDGPVEGSGYLWYQVDPLGFTLDGPGYGWVAMAGKDGEPWIALAGDTQLVVGWPSVSRSGVTMTGAVEYTDIGMDGLSITVSGLTPGESVAFDAVGDYVVKWICGVAPEPCGELGCGPAFGVESAATVTLDAVGVADRVGTATVRIEFRAPSPVAEPSRLLFQWMGLPEIWLK